MDEDLRSQLREVFKAGYFLERQRATLRGISPIDAPPPWLTEEVRNALDAVQEPHSRKKKITLLRIAEAQASGAFVKEIFKSQDCCSDAIWYGRFSPERKIGWMDFPDIALAFALAKKSAHAYYDSMEEQRVVMRRKILDETQDRLTEISGAAVEVLFDIMIDEETASDVRRKAAVDTLTHAAPETAPKSEQRVDVNVATTAGPTMRDIRNRQRKLPGRVVDGGAAEEEVPVLAFEGAEGNASDGPPPPPRGGLRVPEGMDLYLPPENISDNGHDDEEEEEGEGE